MIPLHNIRIATLQRYVWGYAYGANGRALGTTRAHWTHGTINHAYLVSRGEPPPIRPQEELRGLRMHENRTYWMPWSVWTERTRDWMITPLCGRIRTTSQRPSWTHFNGRWGGIPERDQCPDCRALVGEEITYLDTLQREDRWYTELEPHERLTMADPVTGV